MYDRFSTTAILQEESQARVLRFLWKSRAEWGGSEIARQVNMSVPACHEALKKLYARGLVLFRRVSNVHLYKINPDNYLIQNIFAPFFEAEAAIPKQLMTFVRKSLVDGPKSDIISLTLFGSRARGKERLDSDLDLLVIIPTKESLKVLEPRLEKLRALLSKRFSMPLSPYVQTLSELRQKHHRKLPLIGGILRDGRTIYGKDIKELLA